MPYNHLILCHPFLPPSISPSIKVFPNELALCVRWSKCWSFNFSISPSNEYSGLISFLLFITNMECLWLVCQATCIFPTDWGSDCRVSLYQLSNLLSTHGAQEPKSRKCRRPRHTPVPYTSLASLTTCFKKETKSSSVCTNNPWAGRERALPRQDPFLLAASLKRV